MPTHLKIAKPNLNMVGRDNYSLTGIPNRTFSDGAKKTIVLVDDSKRF